MGKIDIKALGIDKVITPQRFTEMVSDLAEATLPLFLIDTDPSDGRVNVACEPTYGVTVRVTVRSYTNFDSRCHLTGAEVTVYGSSSGPPAHAALASRLMADAVHFASLVEVAFSKVEVTFPDK